LKKKIFLISTIIILIFCSSVIVDGEVYSVSPCEFIPESHGEKQLQVWNWGTYMFRQATSTEQWYYAPLHLPDGVILKWLRIHFYDNYDFQYINVTLRRVNKYTKTNEVIFDVSSLGSSTLPVRYETDYTPAVPAWSKVNLGACAYFLMLRMTSYDTGLQFVGATIGYQN
jgi:hypothetical protein